MLNADREEEQPARPLPLAGHFAGLGQGQGPGRRAGWTRTRCFQEGKGAAVKAGAGGAVNHTAADPLHRPSVAAALPRYARCTELGPYRYILKALIHAGLDLN